MPGTGEPTRSSHVLLHARGVDFAVDAADTLELMRSAEPLVAIPRRDCRILGVATHRGSALPVTSIGRWHGAADEPAEAPDEQPLICVLTHDGRRLGLLVRQLGRVVGPTASAVQTVCHDDATSEVFRRTLTVDGRLWPILDAAALLRVSRSWSVPMVDAGAGADGHRQPTAPMAVFQSGSSWFAVPADRAIQVLRTGEVQPIGSGSGRLVGAVSWRSRIVPLVRLQAVVDGQPAPRLMLVVSATKPVDGGRASTAIAIAVDAVDRLQRARLDAPGDPTDAGQEGAGAAPIVALGDGRVVTVVDPDALAKDFAFDWWRAGSSVFEPMPGAVVHGQTSEPARNDEAYLVYRAGERVAIALSCVDEVLVPDAAAFSAAQRVAGSTAGPPTNRGTLIWRGEPLALRSPAGCPSPDDEPIGNRPVLIMRTGTDRHARQVDAVAFIVPVGAAQRCAINWPGRGTQQLLTTVVDGSRETFRIVH